MPEITELDFLVSLKDQLEALRASISNDEPLSLPIRKSLLYSLKILLETNSDPKRTSYLVCMGPTQWEQYLKYLNSGNIQT